MHIKILGPETTLPSPIPHAPGQLEAVAAASTTASTTAIARRPLSSSSTLLQRLRPPAPAVTLASARQHQQQPLQPLVRGFSSSGKGGEGESSEPAERDIKQPSMDVEKDVAVALRGVQELHRAGKYKEVSTSMPCVYICVCVCIGTQQGLVRMLQSIDRLVN